MNFFQSQDKARKQTTRLIILFGLAVLSLIVLTNLLFMGVFGYLGLQGRPLTLEYIQNQFDWRSFLMISIVVVLFVASGSAYKLISLRSGGRVVAEALGGTLVTHGNNNLQYQVLLNVVEEMAIASGTAVPQVYVLKDENAINAFAAGFFIEDAVIGVTQGALDTFNREELQGVIAHEFSHIVHGDMRINIRLLGILHGIMLVGLLGYYIMRASGGNRRSKDTQQLVFLGLGLTIIGYGGMFFGNAIKASVSRQREFLADASAVQFTRNNLGIANALQKIGGYSHGSKLLSSEAQSISHMFFSNAITNKFSSLFATHPPLPERIKLLDPRWSGTFTKTKVSKTPALLAADNGTTNDKSEFDTRGFNMGNGQFDAKALFEGIGQFKALHIALAQNYLAQIDLDLKGLVHSTNGARAFIYALFVSDSVQKSDDKIVAAQWTYLKNSLSNDEYALTQKAFESVSKLEVQFRLPLLEMALPQLREMAYSHYQAMQGHMQYLVYADNKQNIFEWALTTIITRYLKTEFEHADQSRIKFKSLGVVQTHIEMMVSALVYEFCNETEHQDIIANANQILELRTIALFPPEQVNIENFAQAMVALDKLAPLPKEKVLKLCIYLLSNDGVYSAQEHETLRAVADCLGCPMPLGLSSSE